jgi:hypothetical protein
MQSAPDSPWLDRDEREVVRSFQDAGVRFLVVGGRAVQFHGHARLGTVSPKRSGRAYVESQYISSRMELRTTKWKPKRMKLSRPPASALYASETPRLTSGLQPKAALFVPRLAR